VFFSQAHHPGRLCASDFTHCGSLGVTIQGVFFDHLIYHLVLTYSNWETGTVCFAADVRSSERPWTPSMYALARERGALKKKRGTAWRSPNPCSRVCASRGPGRSAARHSRERPARGKADTSFRSGEMAPRAVRAVALHYGAPCGPCPASLDRFFPYLTVAWLRVLKWSRGLALLPSCADRHRSPS